MSQPAAQHDGKPAMLKDSAFAWEDPLDLEGELTEDERMVRDTARGFAQDYLMPRVVEAYRQEKNDPQMLPEMGKLGLLGPTIPEAYGGAGLGYVAYGLISREISERQIRLLHVFSLPVAPKKGWAIDDLLATMRKDKKAVAGRMRFILPTKLGEVALFDDVAEGDARAVLQEIMDRSVAPPSPPAPLPGGEGRKK